MLLLLFLSVSLVTISILARRSKGPLDSFFAFVFVCVIGLATILFFVADWFTGRGLDESVIYHLKHGIQGAGISDFGSLIAWSAIGILLTVSLAILSALRIGKLSVNASLGSSLAFLAVFLVSLAIHPSFIGYIKNQPNFIRQALFPDQDDFHTHYRNPLIRLSNADTKNLVVIYAEGFERSFLDQSAYPGLTPGLSALEKEGISFTQIEELPGTAWTIGGITATMCGLPLFVTSHGNSMSGVEEFLPSATCIGDLLEKKGVSLTYLSGASTEFAGTGKLFRSHGFNRVKGLEQFRQQLQIGKTEGWGLTDDVLFELAFGEFQRSSEKPDPFGLFISTIDTHIPDGRISPSCSRQTYLDGRNKLLNSVACSDEQITRFVRKILNSEYASNTVVVIASDHYIMGNIGKELFPHTDRKNLFVILGSSEPGRQISKPGSQMDFGPTVLPLIGHEIELGLGRNLLSDDPSLSESVPKLAQKLQGWFVPITQFWGFPQLDDLDDIEIKTSGSVVRIGDSKYEYPLLLEIDSDGKTTVRFDSEFDGFRVYDFVARMNPRTAFLWVDRGQSTHELISNSNCDPCAVYGFSASRDVRAISIESDTSVSLRDINESEQAVPPRRSNTIIQKQAVDTSRIIAHAGGQIDGHSYTNSLEALNHSYSNGFRLFELDVVETSDHSFVAAHDWSHWKRLSGFQGELPPTREEFLQQKLLGMYSPLDMNRINAWFERHDDAILVTDKVNSPKRFAEAFVDRKRLAMELFTIEAVKEGIASGILSAMPSQNILRRLRGDKAEFLKNLGVKDVVISRRWINTNGKLLYELKNAGIRTYVFHLNRISSRDEAFAVCSDLDFVYGFYADQYDFSRPPTC